MNGSNHEQGLEDRKSGPILPIPVEYYVTLSVRVIILLPLCHV